MQYSFPLHFFGTPRQSAFAAMDEDAPQPKRSRRDAYSRPNDPEQARSSKWWRDYFVSDKLKGRKGVGNNFEDGLGCLGNNIKS